MNATLNLQASLRDGATYLKQAYFSPPFKIADITEDKQGRDLHLMLMSSSPGILDSDAYTISIEVDAGCCLHLHTQSYQRLFHMKTGATQAMKVALQKDATLVYLPHPVVPHRQSVFTARNDIYLTEGCRLAWGEILTCGRKLNAEVFQLSRYQNITSIYFNNKLVIKENLLIEPALTAPARMGQLAAYTHQASLILLDERMDTAIIKEDVAGLLDAEQDIDYGITAAPVPGIIVRILGNGAEQLHRCLKAIALLMKTV